MDAFDYFVGGEHLGFNLVHVHIDSVVDEGDSGAFRSFAFQPGGDQDPRDDLGQVIYGPEVTLVDTWRALERLVDDGACRSIGLSGISPERLREIVAAARIKPAVVQVESDPYLPEWEPLDFCRERGIVLLAFAPLGHSMEPKIVDDPVITAIAERVHMSPAQVVLSWAAQRGTAFLTTSTTKSLSGRLGSLHEMGFRRYIRGRVDRRIVRSDLGAPGIRSAWW
jgi:hypothetical protein